MSTGALPPPLETERLVLRAHRRADLDDCAAMWCDPIVTRYIGGRPFSRADTWRKLLFYAGMWALTGYGYWAIEEKATRAFVGELGFADFQRDIDPQFGVLPEIGWVLAPAFHGRGYATETVRTVLDWGDARLPATSTICLIDPRNSPSLRVAATAGFSEAARIVYNDLPSIVLRRDAPAGRDTARR